MMHRLTTYPILAPLLLSTVVSFSLLHASAGQQAGPTASDAVGALRHVQLLEVTAGEAPVVRFVTAMRRGADAWGLGRIALFECPIDDVITLGDPVEIMDLPYEVLPTWTWSKRVPWRVIETESGSWLIAHDRHGWVTEIREFPSGETLIRVGGTRSLEDVRLRGDVIEILGCAGRGVDGAWNQPAQVERIRWTIGEDTAVREKLFDMRFLANAPQRAPVATFVSVPIGSPASNTIVIAEMRGWAPVFHVFEDGSEEARTLSPTLDHLDSSPMRVRAWEHDGLRRIVLGMPDWDNRMGRVIVMADDEGVPACMVVDLLPAEAPMEGNLLASETVPSHLKGGHSIEFVNDMDGDGIPDLALGGPQLFLSEYIEMVSSASGKSLSISRTGAGNSRLGTSVSTSPCGRYVLAAGGNVTYPEAFSGRGDALLIDTENPKAPMSLLVFAGSPR